MDRKGLVIWIIGLLVLGLLASYLFNQSRKNRDEMEWQASRNVLMMRDALHRSTEDLRVEIRQFLLYLGAKDGLFGDEAVLGALLVPRDSSKFGFGNSLTKPNAPVSFEESLILSGFVLDSLFAEISSDQDGKKLQAFTKNCLAIEGSKYLSTRVSYSIWLREMASSNTFFDKVALVKDMGDVVYPEELKGVRFQGNESSLSKRFGGSNVGQFEITLDAEVHLGYVAPLVEGKEKIWVIGLKEKEDLVAAAYRIDYTMLTVVLLVLLVLLVALPIISFFGMDKGDELTQRKVYFIGFSMLLLFVVAGWSGSYFFHRPYHPEEEKGLANQIKIELKSTLDQLSGGLGGPDFPNLETMQVNEWLEADVHGEITELKTKKARSPETGNSKPNFQFLSISHRKYHGYFVEKSPLDGIPEFNLVDENQKKKDPYYVERIFSQKDGEPELILSKMIDGQTLHAVSFKLDSIKYSQDRRYLLVKKDGEVVFASRQFEIPFIHLETVLPEKKWVEFQTLSQQKADPKLEWEVPIRINGQEYRALMSPVEFGCEAQQLWFIYLINTNSYHLKASLTSLESLILVSIYLLLLGGIMMFPKLFVHQKYNWNLFAFSWILPKDHKLGQFRKAFLVLTGVIVVLLAVICLGLTSSTPFWTVLGGMFVVVVLVLLFVFQQLRKARFTSGKKEDYYLFVFAFFFLIGFVPGFLIFKQVNTVECQLWTHSLNAESPIKGKEVSLFQKVRSPFFSGISPIPDDQIARYFFPNPEEMLLILNGKREISESENFSKLWKIVALLALIGTLLAGYYGCRYLIRRLFWLDFQMDEENALAGIINEELSDIPNLRLYLCGCDSMVNRYWVYSTFKLNQDELAIIDCAEHGLRVPSKHKIQGKKALLIEDVHCLDKIDDLIRAIPQLLELSINLHLVISSGASWRSLATRLDHEGGNEVDKVRFSELMSGFYFEFVPIKPDTISGEIHPENYFSEEEVEEYLMKKKIIRLDTENSYARLLIQRYGKSYFFNVWSELSTEEKHVCYSYAREGFINPENYEEVVELYQKGVFSDNWPGKRLHLFSKTFRYFVISNASPQTKQLLGNYRKHNSTANNVQWAVLSFLVLAIGLVAYFERSFFTEIQAMVTGVLGFVGFLIGQAKNFFGLRSGVQ